MVEAIVVEYGTEEVLRRLADPVWFQAFGSVLGFDWHSSGLTTVVLGALKESWAARAGDYGLFFAGGKGKASRRTPEEIDNWGSQCGLAVPSETLTDASRMAAKVDSFTLEPHQAIMGRPQAEVLDLSASVHQPIQDASVESARHPETALTTLRKLTESADGSRHLIMPQRHYVPKPGYFNKILFKIYEADPANYAELVALPGVGASTLRALAMVSEVVHGTALTFRDPVRYSFAHGGKDGTPFPVHRPDYLATIDSLERAIRFAKLGDLDKMKTFRRLSQIAGPTPTSV